MVETVNVSRNIPVLTEKELQVIARYYSKPPYVYDARSEPFYEPVYVIGSSGFGRGHARMLAADVVQYELTLGSTSREERESSQKLAVCITCTFLLILLVR